MSTFLFALALAAAADGAAAPPTPSPAEPGAAPVETAVETPTADPRTRVLVLDTGGDRSASERVLLTQIVATRLQRFPSLRVIAWRDVQQRLGLEADKQLAGCESDAVCLAELTGAFDVDLVCTSTAGTLSGTTVFTLQLIDDKGVAKGRGTATLSALDDLAAAAAATVDDAARQATGEDPVAPEQIARPAAPTTPLSSSWRLPLLVGGTAGIGMGVTAAGLGLVPLFLLRGAEGDLTTLRVRYVDSDKDTAILEEAAQKQAEADRLRGLWNSAGLPAFWGGALVAVAGGAVVAAGLLLTPEVE